MDDVRLAPTVGIVASIAFISILVLPYFLINARSVGAYYGAGPVNPLLGGLFALVCIIIFAAGRQDRSDPALVAGVALVFGVFIFGFTVIWAATVPTSLVLSFPTVAVFEYHRFVLVLNSFIIPLSAAWYAYVLGVL